MESFIRSKYESRRWALEGPPPSDPSILDNQSDTSVAPTSTLIASDPLTQTPPPPPPSQTQTHSRTGSSFTRATATQPITTRQPQPHQLLSTVVAGRPLPTIAPTIPGPGQPRTQAQQQKAPEPENDLFSLDFHAPSNGGAMMQPRKDVKNDILSLFSTPAQANAGAANNNAFGQFQSFPPTSAAASAPWGSVPAQSQPGSNEVGAWGTAPMPASTAAASPWGSFGSTPAQPAQMQPQTTSMVGSNGVGAWGTSSGWTPPAAAAPPAQGNLWGAPPTAPVQQQPDLNVWGSSGGGLGNGGMSSGGMDLWGSSGGGGTGQGAQGGQKKKDDMFGDLWGGFK